MRVLVAGATGLLGRPLCGELLRRGHSVTALSRDASRATRLLPRGTETASWSEADVEAVVERAYAIVNLTGESVGGRRWTAEYKKRLLSSRVDTTRTLVEAMRASGRTDQTLVNASAVGYYGDTGAGEVTEATGPGTDFLAELCSQWEAEAHRAEQFGARVAVARYGHVLSGDGGTLERMIPIFKLGLGGPLGTGRQWFSWIHHADAVRLTLHLLETPDARGPYNVTAPEPVTISGLAHALGRVLGRPALLRAPAFALKIVLGELAESILTGQKALPRAAERAGFQWKYPTLERALGNIIRGEEDE